MRRTWNLLIYLAIALVIVLVAASVFAVVTVRRTFPQTDGEIEVPGLSADVRIVRDEQGIPQVYADHANDLFYAQGFVHAQDRFYEMDFRRHVTAGRLAELVGESALQTDMFVRTLGWRATAKAELAMLDPETRRYLQAYADGVNAYLGDRSAGELSLEYSVLALTGPDYVPQEWTPADSVAWLKALAWDLNGNMSAEIDRALALEVLEPEQVEELYPAYPYDEHAPIVTAGRVRGGLFQQGPGPVQRVTPEASLPSTTAGDEREERDVPVGDLRGLDSLRDVVDGLPRLLGTREGIGSNSWVVSGDRTASGAPILANDPHLAPSMPSMWYQMGLHCNERTEQCPFDVSGFTFSGLPGVVVGHNQSIAWGLTTMYPDVSDLYLEQVDDEAGTYRYDGGQVQLQTRTEQFRVAGEEDPVAIEVRSTRHGPILSDLEIDPDPGIAAVGERTELTPATEPADGDGYAVSLRWTGSEPGRTMDALIGIDKARSWDEFRQAARLMDAPSQNLVYADVEGRIGYQAPGRIPIRAPGHSGRWPVPGWNPANEWRGFIPFDELPTVLDPPSGLIVTANNAVIGPDYPYLLTSDAAYGYRSQRILELLEDRDDLTAADMAELQNDTYNAHAERLTPYLLDISMPTPYFRDGQAELQGWDFTQPADSAAAAYFNAVWRNLLELTFHDQLPPDVRPDGGERWFEVVEKLLEDPDSDWWDDIVTEDVRETRDDILRRALLDARDDLTVMQGSSPTRWSWGGLHELELVNPTLGDSGVGLVESLFNRGPYPLGGGSGIVNATGWDAAEGFDVTAVPSMRMVVSLDDFDESRWIQFGGQSGHAYADTYTDQTQLWAAGGTLPWAWSHGAVDAAATDELFLRASSS
ncbi:MAG: penicillin acylase family protein [Actinomycetota bacterium]|nr:penicillin acylase family protein [Actinomycetota bacterium]